MENVINFIENLAIQAKEGEVNELDVYIKLKQIEEISKKAKQSILNEALEESRKYHEKTFNFNGFSVTKSQKTTWKYDHLENWQQKKKELKEIEELAKKTHGSTDHLLINQDTGEVIKSAKKTVTDTLVIKRL